MKVDQAFTALANAIRKHGTPVCQTTDPEVWFPNVGDGNGDTRMAKRLCAQCPVKNECLNFAIVNDEQYGIWGGLSVRERDRLKGRTRR